MLGLLVADGGRFVTPGLFGALLLLNPSDAFRLLNLAGFTDARLVAGLGEKAIWAKLVPDEASRG